MHRNSPAPFVDLRIGDGEMVVLGELRLHAIHTPGTRATRCACSGWPPVHRRHAADRRTGRTDLPSGDPEALYDSLFHRILRLDPELDVFPPTTTRDAATRHIAQESRNPRLQKRDRGEFVEMMRNLSLTMPTHITEALRTNMSGGKTVAQLLAEAAASVPFMSLAELKARVELRKTT